MIQSQTDLADYIAADLQMHGLDGWRPQYRLTRRIVFFQWLLRRCEYWENCRRDPVGRIASVILRFRMHRLGERLGFTIPRNAFGPGLSIAHPGTIVVNLDVRVGASCRIHQGVTLGSLRGRSPTIGDRVMIGANACVLGGVTVGDDVAIGAGAVVLHDVQDGVTVAGVPARQVSPRGSGAVHPWAVLRP